MGVFRLLIPLLCLLSLAEVSHQESQKMSIHDYCIVGAGPAGLQLGYFLKQAGRDYIIYDKADRPGEVQAIIEYKKVNRTRVET